MTWELRGRSVLVTGAARGIGAESARRLAARGAKLSLVGFEPEELERVSAQCPGSVVFEADVTDRDALARAVTGTLDALGGIDVVIANAGIAAVGMIERMDSDSWERTIEVNLLGSYRTITTCLPHVIERRGYVLQIASMIAVAQMGGMSAYAASKAGVAGMANAIRPELRHKGVDVGCAYFSWIDTDMVAGEEAHALTHTIRTHLRPPFHKGHPVEKAAAAVVRGVARRSRWVAHPRWIVPMMFFGPVPQLLSDRDMVKVMPEAESAYEAMIARDGIAAASAPVGAGGAADPAAAPGGAGTGTAAAPSANGARTPR